MIASLTTRVELANFARANGYAPSWVDYVLRGRAAKDRR